MQDSTKYHKLRRECRRGKLARHSDFKHRKIKIVAESSIFWLRVAACLYAVGLLHSMLAVARRKHNLYSVALGAFQIGVVLHAVAIVELSGAYGRLPVDNVYVTLGLGAFLIALVFLIVEWK